MKPAPGSKGPRVRGRAWLRRSVLSLAVLCAVGEVWAQEIRAGDTLARVNALLGESKGYVESGNEQTYVYSKAVVTFRDGKAVRWKYRVEEPASNAAPAGTHAPQAVQHKAVGAAVLASSTRRQAADEGPLGSLVDGDLTTRWSSGYSEPQEVILHFTSPFNLGRIRLHWEAAVAREYDVSASADGTQWTTIGAVTNATPGPRVDDLDGGGLFAASLKLHLLKRLNPEWGFSLYEIEVSEKPASTAPALKTGAK